MDTAQNRYLGLKEFREFLEDYQEEHLDDTDIIALIHVRNVAQGTPILQTLLYCVIIMFLLEGDDDIDVNILSSQKGRAIIFFSLFR